MNSVFLDTVGILAVLDEDDQWHLQAARAFERIVQHRQNIITTEFVQLECGNALARTPFRADIDDLRRELRLRSGIIEISAEELEEAWRIYRQGQAGAAGVVDLVSFAAMRRLRVTDAFTNDRHFATAGFATLF
jgi:predicted nucleic acid-binding protein